MIIAIYNVSANNELGSMIFEQTYIRTEGNNQEGTTFGVPETTLPSGKYFFEVRQLDGVNIAIAFDDVWWDDSHLWVNIPNIGVFESVFEFGYIHVRPNFGNPPVGISREKATKTQLALYPNPAKGVLNVSLDDTYIEKIVIYNASGQVIQSISNINDSSYKIDTEKLTSGIYFITVQTKTSVITSKFVVK